MKTDGERKIYRIGEYARYMGVTPDLLKHYEELGIIHPEAEANGYRYYPFSQSFRLLECMKLRGYGLTLRDAERLLNGLDGTELRTVLAERMEQLEKENIFSMELVADCRAMLKHLDALDGRFARWYVTEDDSLLWLPHSEGRCFVQDDRVYEILKDWTGRMPLVRQAMLIPPQCLNDGNWRGAFRWGLAIPAGIAERIALPVNSVVERLRGGRCLHWYYRDLNTPDSLSVFDGLRNWLTNTGEEVDGPVCRVELMTGHENGVTVHMGCFIVPLKES